MLNRSELVPTKNEIKSQVRFRGILTKPETITFYILIAVFVFLMIISESFRDAGYIVKAISRNVEFGLVAFSLTFVVISGMIDLSVASIMTLSSAITILVYTYLGVPMVLCIVIGLISGMLMGALNGALVAYLKIAPIIATIGTLSLYRGIAQIFIGDHSLGDFPEWFNSVDRIYAFTIGNMKMPYTIIGLLVVAIIMFLILKYTTTGRKIYAIGTNETAAIHSGINVPLFKFMLLTINGLFCAAAGLLMISRLLVVRHDMALGGELDMVTIVILGGTSFVGGKGNILGTLFGLLTVVLIRSGLSVAGITVDEQLFALGALLLLSIVIPKGFSLIREYRLNKKVNMALLKKQGH